MKLFKLNKNILCNIICLILLIIIIVLIFTPPKEGFVKLIDYTNADPNIKPKPPQDPCLGDLEFIRRGGDNKGQGLFITNTNSNYLVVPQNKSVQSDENHCEASCDLRNDCVGIKFDQDLYDKQVSQDIPRNKFEPNCTKYTAAPAGTPNTISSTSICTHQPYKCTVKGYSLNPKDNTITSEYGTFIHSNEGACAYECTMRQPECKGYWYDPRYSGDTDNENHGNCKIFKNLNNNESTGIPKNMYCSKSKIDNSKNWKQIPSNISDPSLVCGIPSVGHGSARFNTLDQCKQYFNKQFPYTKNGYMNFVDLNVRNKYYNNPTYHNCWWVGDRYNQDTNRPINASCKLRVNDGVQPFKSYYLPGTPIIDLKGKNITPTS